MHHWYTIHLLLEFCCTSSLIPDLAVPVPLVSGGSGAVTTGGSGCLPESTATSAPRSVGQQAQAAGNSSTNAGEIVNSCYHSEIDTMLRFCLRAVFSTWHMRQFTTLMCVYY